MRLLALLCALVGIFAAPIVAASPIPAGTSQMLLVRTADWQATVGTLQRYTRTGAGSNWRPVGPAFPVVLGRSGLGWGRGLASAPAGVPGKQEGDGRSPAGVYTLTAAYGYAPRPPAGSTLPYTPLTAADRCVDDAGDPLYNRIVRIGPERPVTWHSAEVMRRDDELYRWVVFVAHNSTPPVAGGGSCIFLHVWRDHTSPTAGCTAMARENLEALLAWLDPAAQPVLVQLPEALYSGLRAPWTLP